MSKLNVCFIGFFGMKSRHANKYVNLWNGLNVSTDVYNYSYYKDVLKITNYNKIREELIPIDNYTKTFPDFRCNLKIKNNNLTFYELNWISICLFFLTFITR